MSLDARQLLVYVVRPALAALGPACATLASEQLVLGTAAQESDLSYIHQLGHGPAVGLWQVEPFTYRDLTNRVLASRPALKRAVLWLAARRGNEHGLPPVEELHWNLALACAICRVKYLSIGAPLPPANDVGALARYWKRWYNTELGAGQPEEFCDAWARHCAPLYPEAR